MKHWRSLAKKEARAAKEAGEAHVPVAQRAEAAYIPSLLTEFLDVCARVNRWSCQVVEPAGQGCAKQQESACTLPCF